MKFRYFIFMVLAGALLGGCILKPPTVKPNSSDYLLGQPGQPQADAANTNQAMTATTPPQSPELPTPEQPVTAKQATIKTNLGDITFEFYPESPKTVANFVKLARAGFYNGVRFHRVIKDFMVQTGDPNSKDDDWSNDGRGGPGYTFADEFNQHKLVRGSVAMANAGPDTNGSQFFIVTAQTTPWLDGKHTNFGQVVSGMDVLEKIAGAKVNANDHPLENITITSVEVR